MIELKRCGNLLRRILSRSIIHGHSQELIKIELHIQMGLKSC